MHAKRSTALTRRLPPALLLAAVLLLVPFALQAQSSTPADSSPFRPKQFGVEFGLGGNFASVGLLRFATPQRALLFNVEGQYRSTTGGGLSIPIVHLGEVQPPNGQDDYQFGARVGLRRYRPVTERVQRFATLGVLAAAGRQTLIRGQFETSNVGGGAFAELGAAWMVTPNLSLGAVWNADLVYSRLTNTTSVGQSAVQTTGNQFAASFGGLSVRGNIYF